MPNIDPSHQNFLNKLQNIYSKKSSQTSMSSYRNKQSPQQRQNFNDNYASLNPIKKEHALKEQKWVNVQQEIQSVVMPFKKSLVDLIHNIPDENKFYRLLQIMRKNEILSDVAHEINETNAKQTFLLKGQLEKLKYTLAHLSKSHRQSKSTQKNPQNSPHSSGPFVQKIDSTRSMPENIYYQAKLMKQDEFVEWCDKILMKNKIVITQLKRELTPKKFLLKNVASFNSKHNRSLSAIYDGEIQNDHPSFYENYSSLVKKIQELSPLTQVKQFETMKTSILEDIENLKVQKITCPKYCCSLQNQKPMIDFTRTSNNKLFSRSYSKAKDKNSHEVYRNNKTDQYFSRYYKHPSFKMDQIKSVEHTKAQQMNRLEDQYHRMLENRSKLRYGF